VKCAASEIIRRCADDVVELARCCNEGAVSPAVVGARDRVIITIRRYHGDHHGLAHNPFSRSVCVRGLATPARPPQASNPPLRLDRPGGDHHGLAHNPFSRSVCVRGLATPARPPQASNPPLRLDRPGPLFERKSRPSLPRVIFPFLTLRLLLQRPARDRVPRSRRNAVANGWTVAG
jgi:hypothetical protein